MACSSFTDSANRRIVLSGPFKADEYRWVATPRRCSGLSHVAALRLKSPAIPQPLQVGFDGLLQFRGLGELGVQFGDQARHLFLKQFTVVFDPSAPT